MLLTTDEYVRRLVDDDYCLSVEHQTQRFGTRWDDAGASVKAFEDAFVKEAAKRRIPVHANAVAGECLSMVHSQFGDLLEAEDWAIIGRIGLFAARKIDSAEVTWHGENRWTVVDDTPPF